MPELPDIVAYLAALNRLLPGASLLGVTVRSPFVLRTFEPEIAAAAGRTIVGFSRIGKRIVIELDPPLYLVIHLMRAGRFHWRKAGAKPKSKADLAAFEFEFGTLMLTEAGTKKRAALHVMENAAELEQFQRGGLDLFECTPEQFEQRLLKENHTLKRALTDPRLFDGIGNAYSDEILHDAELSPIKWTSRLSADDIARLLDSIRKVLSLWTDRLVGEAEADFPEKVTAFRPEMAVHGKYGEPCPVCDVPIQRIVYAESEVNYCPGCQTEGKILADRSLSRLLKSNWPRSIDELE